MAPGMLLLHMLPLKASHNLKDADHTPRDVCNPPAPSGIHGSMKQNRLIVQEAQQLKDFMGRHLEHCLKEISMLVPHVIKAADWVSNSFVCAAECFRTQPLLLGLAGYLMSNSPGFTRTTMCCILVLQQTSLLSADLALAQIEWSCRECGLPPAGAAGNLCECLYNFMPVHQWWPYRLGP